MPILTAVFTLLSKQLSSLLRAILGWSVSALFGRLSDTRVTILSAVLVASLGWPVLVLGIIFPPISAWVFAMVPLEKWVGPDVVRLGSLALALLVPAAIGLTVRAIAPAGEVKGGVLRTVIGGYPMTLGFALSCLITAVVVPAVRIGTIARGWSDAHVYVQPKKGRYEASVAALAHACEAAGVSVQIEPVPFAMDLAGRVLKFFARGTLDALVPSGAKRLRASSVELYLYPADLLLRGKTNSVARVRARLVDCHLDREAMLVAEKDAQVIQNEIARLDEVREGAGLGDRDRDRIRRTRALLDDHALPFEEWILLDRNLRRIEDPKDEVARDDRRSDARLTPRWDADAQRPSSTR